MDQIDKRILQALQRNGRLQNVELAQIVGLSPSPCLRRVKQLEDDGIIEKYAALLNPQKVNLGLTVFARIWLKGQDAKTVNAFVEDGGRLRFFPAHYGGGSGCLPEISDSALE